MMTDVSIEIALASVAPCSTHASSGNHFPLLHEVKFALARLMETGEPSCIDLRSLPMGPGDEAILDAFLGVGEVEASIAVLGKSCVLETSFAGVWLVTHQNEEGQILSRFIEIARLPRLLESPLADIRSGYQRLTLELDRLGGTFETDRPEGAQT